VWDLAPGVPVRKGFDYYALPPAGRPWVLHPSAFAELSNISNTYKGDEVRDLDCFIGAP
jgi:hypothetical protein